ncbi:MAG: cytochrome c4 [Acidiferrobacteraceae bacterium]|nr:cytochrome c4 [Acidiferrobacteraceae bacterium]|tara:strand:+ start:3968 stop:4555 length:588 start_codon:yes stop_codon:yes gene_type:complete
MKQLIIIISILSLGAITSTGFAAGGDPEAGQIKSVVCAACHGADGNSDNPEYPSLAGQVPGYIEQQLANFKSGNRTNTIMIGMAQMLTPEDMSNLDAWYASQTAKVHTISDDQLENAQLGEKLYQGSACMGCHGPAGGGIPPNFPRLAGQHSKYTEAQLLLFKSEQRLNPIMTPIAAGLSPKQIRAIAIYLSGLH